MRRENKRKLPKAGAKRYGHRSSVSSDRMIRKLHKGGYFEEWERKAQRLVNGV
jgi:hypothetical protein